MKGLPQISLRELLMMVLFAGLGLASLRTGGILAAITAVLATVSFTCFAIVVFVGRGQFRIYAIGFVIPVVIYIGIVILAGQRELDPYDGRLPTSRVLQGLFRVLATQEWTDIRTGKIVQNYDSSVHGFSTGSGGMGGLVTFAERPDRPTFMSLGHILLATIFGYGGARFALAVHRKQEIESQHTRDRSDSSRS